MSDDGFLSRWSRRKRDVKAGLAPDEAPPVSLVATTAPAAAGAVRPVPVAPPMPAEAVPAPVEAPAEPLPTLADVAALTRDDSYARFVAPGVDPSVRNAAMKKLFTDPRYNVMDGLDIYIDDYSQPDPIPIAMLRRMNQSKTLGLFDHEEADAAAAASADAVAGADPNASANAAPPDLPTDSTPEAETPPDEDPDLQLQPDDGAGRAGAGPRPDGSADT